MPYNQFVMLFLSNSVDMLVFFGGGGGGSFPHEPIYASKGAHFVGPITPVVMDSSTELGSFLMMTSDWGLSQSSEIFFIIVAGYVLY